MALPMVVLAKLSLIAATPHSGLTPLTISLLWPFILKFAFSFQPLQETFTDLFYAVRLFFFQMAQITFEPELGATGGGARWQRALRLVYERVVHARHAQVSASREESMLSVSMLVL